MNVTVPRDVRIAPRRGVLAFRHDRRGPWGETPTLRSESLRVGARVYRLVSYRGGEWEVYRVDADGLELFLGYAPDAIRWLARGKA